ncbi:MAG: three-Cys-motif partner protein TcmP [Campylobacteraceae bacterium]|nr:three-Cys-motif partner protein TcmP [Campylobacteraceae bacterium]
MADGNNHFESKRPHTEIKHAILKQTLTISASIADYSGKANEAYTYIDVYAGGGKFKDGQYGSPMIAIGTINNNAKKLSKRFIFCEKNEENYKELLDSISDEKNAKAYCDEWTNKEREIFSPFANSTWGFAFIDSFDNFTGKAFDILTHHFSLSHNKLKEMLIFFNFQALKRLMPNHSKQVADTLKTTEEIIIDIRDNKNNQDEKLAKLIFEQMKKADKNYVLGGAIPTSRNGKIIESNNFYMVFGTNSIGVAWSFFDAYCDAISDKKDKSRSKVNLFTITELEDNIKGIIDKYKKLNLLDLVQEVWQIFVGWKDYSMDKNIPTKNNIKNILNTLISNGFIKCYCDSIEIGKISSEALKTNKNLKKYIIQKL